MFNQQGAPQTHQSVLEISMNIGIRLSSFGESSRDLFRAINAVENNVKVVRC